MKYNKSKTKSTTLQLDEEDNLYDSNSYILVHNTIRHSVDPLPCFQTSRRFIECFQKNQKKCGIKDKYSDQAFCTYLCASQMKPIAPTAQALVDLLIISDDWDSPTLLTKIETLINTEADPNEVIRLFKDMLERRSKNTSKLERIIALVLPRYLETKRFPSLNYTIIERMILGYPGKLTPEQIIKLCYAASSFCGLNSIGFVKKNSFEGVTREQVIEIADLFEKSPYPPLQGFMAAFSRLIHQMLGPIVENESFDKIWTTADTGSGDDAFEFYKICLKEPKKNTFIFPKTIVTKSPTKVSRTRTASQTATISMIEEDEFLFDPDSEPRSPTQFAFLKAAAERGHALSQYSYGRYLFNHRQSESREDEALSFLIQAAAKDIQEAKTLLNSFFVLDKIESSVHQEIYKVLALQNLLLYIDSDKYEITKSSIISLHLEHDVMLLANNIIKCVQVRQRLQYLYARLICDLIKIESYEKLSQNIFSVIMSSLYTENPMHAQFLNIQFLRVLYNDNVIPSQSFSSPVIDFLCAASKFPKSALMIFYFFADIIMDLSDEIFNILKLKLFNHSSGIGNIDILLIHFRDNFNNLMMNNAAEFKVDRKSNFIRDPVTLAIINDDIKTLRKLNFDINQPILNYGIDLTAPDEESYGTETLLPIQFAASQGSEACFLWLLRRMPHFNTKNDCVSATCAAAGQNKFILGFVTGLSVDMREEMLRMAAKWNNVYLTILLLQNDTNINAPDDNMSTALHFACRNGNPTIVKILIGSSNIDVNSADDHGVTPLHYAVFSSKVDIVKIMCQCPDIDLNVQDEHMSTPLHYAVWNNDIDLVELLLQQPKIDANVRAKLDRTPLHEAAKCGYLEILRLLSEHASVDMNARDKNNRTPLRLAMKRGQVEVVQYLRSFTTSSITSSAHLSMPSSNKDEDVPKTKKYRD